MQMNVKLMRSSSVMPEYQSEGAAAFDLVADVPAKVAVIPSRTSTKVRTGVAVEIPQGSVGLLTIRSGLAAETGLMLANGIGVIDSDYRGEIMVALKATTSVIDIKPGQRIAQLMIVPVAQAELVQVEDLSETDRGEGGFGSTGKTTRKKTSSKKAAP